MPKEDLRFQSAVKLLKNKLVQMRQKSDFVQTIIDTKEEVFARFQPIFSLDHIPKLSESEFKEFLQFKNNKHWTGLHRQGPKIIADMGKLREALSLLLDDSLLIEERLNETALLVNGMGKAIATAILLIVFPEKYGVWNNTSEGGLKTVGLWPKFEKGESLGERYKKVNEILLSLSHELQIDLWELDTLWWFVSFDDEPVEEIDESTKRFGLERHLQEFIRDNWEHLSLSKDWKIFSENGEEVGYEYPCGPIGRIDILAKHRTKPEWLVIELKKGQSSDKVVGQILRYIGWVKKEVADSGDKIRGLIIIHSIDEQLQYAVLATNDIEVMTYEVIFQLKKIT